MTRVGVRAALERAGHGEVKLGDHGGATVMETMRVATPESERCRKMVKEVREGEAKLGS